MNRLLKDQSGVALLVTLLVVIILTVSVTEFLYASWIDRALAADFRDDFKSLAAVRSGLEAGRTVIIEDYKDDQKNNRFVDSLQEEWAQEIPIPTGGDIVFVKITDESSKIDLNRLVTNTDLPDQAWLAVFQRLLHNLGLDSQIADSLIDWLDANHSGYAEDNYYLTLEAPYPCKNGKMDTVEELRRVRHVTPEAYILLAPFVTVRSSGRVNVNTAPKEVLMALHTGITDLMASDLIKAREKAVFVNTQEVRTQPGFEALFIDINPLIAVTSDSFSVTSSVKIGEVVRKAQALYTSRNTDKVQLVSYQVM